jgi:hypothetical protein
MKEWQQDNWTELTTEDNQVLDVNLWTDDITGRQYISFYHTFADHQEWRETNATKSIATYRVILEEKN